MARSFSLLSLLASTSLLLAGCGLAADPDPKLSEISRSAAADSCSTEACTSLTFTGDFLVHNMLWAQAAYDAQVTGAGSQGLDFEPLIEEQKPYLAVSDLGVCQMETVVAQPEGPFSGYPDFNVPPQILDAAAKVGWDVCMTASNHSIDQKTAGLKRTYEAVKASGMGVTGTNLSEEEAQEPDIFTTANGARVALITGTYGLNEQVPEHDWQVDMLDTEAMIAKARKAREAGADLVIANMHAGTEYVHEPNAQQIKVAHALVDSQLFDLVVGEHAHAVQPIERYKDTWIVYGMGNNITEKSPVYSANNEGIMVNAIFARDKDGKWSVEKLRWVASSMVDTYGYRYCITSPKNLTDTCISQAEAAASYARVKKVVESQGAREAGLEEWVLEP